MASLSWMRGRAGENCSWAQNPSKIIAPSKMRKRWALVSARSQGHDNGKTTQQQRWPVKLCAVGLSALLMLRPQSFAALSILESLTSPPSQEEAHAAGLLPMPPPSLNNTYFLVRAGLSNFESLGVIHTNPVSKTSVDSGLSNEGMRQTTKAAVELQSLGACDGGCWIWPSITQRSYQAAEVIADVNGVTYSRIVPEYSFLDARGLGAYENRKLSTISEIYARDLESSTARPPKFTDGTPNESVSDVLVRVTQLMSILETQYFGDTVIIVSPDSDNLSVLQSALTGKDVRGHSGLAFAPGEVRRIDINDLPPRRPLTSGKFKMITN